MKKVFAAVVTTGLLIVAVTVGPAVSAGSLKSSLFVPPVVSGNVTYGNPHPSSIRPVADVDLTAVGDPMVEGRTGPDRTPTWGQYSLTGFGESAYSVTPHKGGSLNNFINSFDAAKIAQHVTGISYLDSTQVIVADVSGNGVVQSFDAALIAGFVVNTPVGHGSTGTWIFSPFDRSYPFVIDDIPNQDYTGLLMGEVSGNWNNNGNGGNGGLAGGPERQTVITAPEIVSPARQIMVPVKIGSGADKEIISYEFDLRYDASVIRPSQIPVSTAGTVSRGFSIAVNAREPGLLRVAVYGALPIDRDGVLLNLRFNAIGTAGDVSPLIFERVMINEGDPVAVPVAGTVELSRATSGRSDG
jgi:hypothetical protein